MEIRVSIEAVITLPKGTIVPEQGRAFTLPSGDWVKPFVVLEMNDGTDMTFKEAAALGVYVDETNIEWFDEGEEEDNIERNAKFEEVGDHMKQWMADQGGMALQEAFKDPAFLNEMIRVMGEVGINQEEEDQ